MSDALIDGARVAYDLTGPDTAPVIVLVHSLGTSRALWADLVPALAGRFRVLAYDLPGHGSSSAPAGPYAISSLADTLAGLLDHLGVETASICGLSIGASVATDLAARHSGRVARLVLACSAPVLASPPEWHARASAVRDGGLALLVEDATRAWFTPEFRLERPEVVEAAAAQLRACAPEGYAGCCEALAACDQWELLSGIAVPTLVVCGADDPIVTPEMALAHAAALPGAELVVLPGAAHLAHLAAPARFCALVAEHVASDARSAGMAVRRAVLGDAHVERASAAAAGFGAAFDDLITRYAWGEIWARPGLERRMRSALTLAILVSLGRVEELAFHVPAALRNGLSPSEIEEIFLQCAIYAGVPAANRAFAVARPLVADRNGPDRNGPDRNGPDRNGPDGNGTDGNGADGNGA